MGVPVFFAKIFLRKTAVLIRRNGTTQVDHVAVYHVKQELAEPVQHIQATSGSSVPPHGRSESGVVLWDDLFHDVDHPCSFMLSGLVDIGGTFPMRINTV